MLKFNDWVKENHPEVLESVEEPGKVITEKSKGCSCGCSAGHCKCGKSCSCNCKFCK